MKKGAESGALLKTTGELEQQRAIFFLLEQQQIAKMQKLQLPRAKVFIKYEFLILRKF